VAGHHHALVLIEDLTPATCHPYTVVLDDEVAWPPPGSGFPVPTIRTRDPREPIRVIFGSCRVSAPHVPPSSYDHRHRRRGLGVDALVADALQLIGAPGADQPDVLMLLGDQVYAPRVSAERAAFIPGHREIRAGRWGRTWPTSRSTPGSTGRLGLTRCASRLVPCRRP
jgi:hypothetical protein